MKMIKTSIMAFALALIMGTVLFAAPQKFCPVMGGEIDKKYHVDYNGRRIYFCCGGCPEEFKKNPEKYMKKMQKDGVDLEKSPAGK